jgi:hypothetical protein
MGLFETETLLGFAWVCTNCMETKANHDVTQCGKKGPTCNLCGTVVFSCHIYKEHVEGYLEKIKQDAPTEQAEPGLKQDEEK